MRRRTVLLAAAAAIFVLVPAALVSAYTRHRDHWTVTHHIPRWSRLLGAHLGGSSAARTASAPAGSNNGNYCSNLAVDGLFTYTFSPGPASGSVTTSTNNELVVAFVGSSGPKSGGQSVTVSGGGLSWHTGTAVNTQGGDVAIAYAFAPSKGTYKGITATQGTKGYAEALMMITYKGASGNPITNYNTNSSAKGTPTGTLTTQNSCGWVFAVGNDPAATTKRTPGSGQNIWTTTLLSGKGYGAPSTFWVQSTTTPTATMGTPVTINDTAPSSDPFNLALAEIH
jgi:hypothetical protein